MIEKITSRAFSITDELYKYAKEQIFHFAIENCKGLLDVDDIEDFEDFVSGLDVSDFFSFFAKIRKGEKWGEMVGATSVNKIMDELKQVTEYGYKEV